MRASLHLGLWAATLSAGAGTAAPALAHVGGVPASLRFVEPQGIVRVASDSQPVRWLDTDQDPTAVFRFSYQPGGAPPFKVPQEPFFHGTRFAEAQENDAANQLSWDVAALPAGAYFVYAQSFDPPLCDLVHFAPAMVVVEHAGQPRPLAALVVDPPLGNAPANAEARIEIQAYGPARPRVTVRAGLLRQEATVADGGPCDSLRRTWQPEHTLLRDAPLDPDPTTGPDFWRGVLQWETRNVPAGDYVIEVRATDDDGRSTTVYSAGAVAVWHPEATDGGTDGGTLAPPDGGAGDGGGASAPRSAGGCSVRGTAGGAAIHLLLLAALLILARHRTRP